MASCRGVPHWCRTDDCRTDAPAEHRSCTLGIVCMARKHHCAGCADTGHYSNLPAQKARLCLPVPWFLCGCSARIGLCCRADCHHGTHPAADERDMAQRHAHFLAFCPDLYLYCRHLRGSYSEAGFHLSLFISRRSPFVSVQSPGALCGIDNGHIGQCRHETPADVDDQQS